ncbi:MAG: hypothetical protein AAFU79_14890 [Myxococcota bacterium]
MGAEFAGASGFAGTSVFSHNGIDDLHFRVVYDADASSRVVYNLGEVNSTLGLQLFIQSATSLRIGIFGGGTVFVNVLHALNALQVYDINLINNSGGMDVQVFRNGVDLGTSPAGSFRMKDSADFIGQNAASGGGGFRFDGTLRGVGYRSGVCSLADHQAAATGLGV